MCLTAGLKAVEKGKSSDSAANLTPNPLCEHFLPTGRKVTKLSELQTYLFLSAR